MCARGNLRHVPQFAFSPLPKPKALGAPPKLLAICDRPVPAAVPELVLRPLRPAALTGRSPCAMCLFLAREHC